MGINNRPAKLLNGMGLTTRSRVRISRANCVSTIDGRAALAVYSQRNLRRETPATYLKRNYRTPGQAMDYVRVTRSFFAVSAVHEGTIYYSRCNSSRRSGGTIHCFDLKYPASEKRAWDDMVTRISRSLEPLGRG